MDRPAVAQVAMPATAAQLATARRFFDGAGGAPGVGAGVAAGVRDRVVGRVQARQRPGVSPKCPELPSAGRAGARHAGGRTARAKSVLWLSSMREPRWLAQAWAPRAGLDARCGAAFGLCT